ncbi:MULTISPECIES: hypothetical protein [Streptomyces]|nr:hypothetical protein [Streptomyces sp. WI03-4A]MDX2593038.1 hypothetical protein [Streptomyces sp. WI03-4A]
MTGPPGRTGAGTGPDPTGTGVDLFASALHFHLDGDIHGGARLERRTDVG